MQFAISTQEELIHSALTLEIFSAMCTISLLTKHLTLEYSWITFICVKQLYITITNARVKQLKEKVKVYFGSVLKVSVHGQSDSLLWIL